MNEVLIDYIRDTLGKISDEALRDSTWVESLRSIILLKVLLVFNSWRIKLNISGPGWRRSAPGSYTFGQNGLDDMATYSTVPITYSACLGGYRAALIVRVAVDKLTVGPFSAPIATT